MTNLDPNSGNNTKSDIFPWDIFKSNITFFYQEILKYLSDFRNRNFSILWQK